MVRWAEGGRDIHISPYVGQIDYHEQHRYAYELFGFERRDRGEIGAKALGKGRRAREKYVEEISMALSNAKQQVNARARWFVVANDALGLYKDIFDSSGLCVVREHRRPVEDRTERDKRPYSESVFELRSG